MMLQTDFPFYQRSALTALSYFVIIYVSRNVFFFVDSVSRMLSQEQINHRLCPQLRECY